MTTFTERAREYIDIRKSESNTFEHKSDADDSLRDLTHHNAETLVEIVEYCSKLVAVGESRNFVNLQELLSKLDEGAKS